MEGQTPVVLLLVILPVLAAPCTSALIVKTMDEYEFLERLSLSSVVGPESLVFDLSGQGPYTGVSDGRVLKWQGSDRGWTQFAVPSNRTEEVCDGSHDSEMESVCGRPLGLQFYQASGELYIADAYFGLLVVGADGGVAELVAAEAEGEPFKFTNGIDVDQETGMVYFTDSSTVFHRRDYNSVVIFGDKTGRLMSYNPQNKQLSVLLNKKTFPNGVALSENNDFLLVAETSNCRVNRYWLHGPHAGNIEVFANLPGYPDNIKRNSDGDFWVALYQEEYGVKNFFGWHWGRTLAVKLNKKGEIVEELRGRMSGSISEVDEMDGSLWIGSVELPFVGVYQA